MKLAASDWSRVSGTVRAARVACSEGGSEKVGWSVEGEPVSELERDTGRRGENPAVPKQQ